jgi:hypothetical protein
VTVEVLPSPQTWLAGAEVEFQESSQQSIRPVVGDDSAVHSSVRTLRDDKRSPPVLRNAAEDNPDHAVLVVQRRAIPAADQDLELMAEGDALQDQCFAKLKWPLDQGQDEMKHRDTLAAPKL